MVIEGRADHPVFLKIIDRQIALCDAGHLWGKGIDETNKALRQDPGKPAGVLCIGQAGENQVAFSMAYVDGIATMGRGGLGAMLGAKNLKAVVVTGTRGIQVADQQLQRREIEQMTADYYEEWGWDKKTGAPTPGALRKLGLQRTIARSWPR